MRIVFGAVILLLLVSGCGYTPAAQTTLTLSESENPAADMPVGFTEAVYDDPRGRIVIVGHGWMPREHKSRVYAWDDGLQPVRSRWFRLISEPPVDDKPRVWTIELVVDPSLPRTGQASETLVRNDIYTGSFTTGHTFNNGALALEFPNIRLSNIEDESQTLLVSGHVAASRASQSQLTEMREGFELAMDFR